MPLFRFCPLLRSLFVVCFLLVWLSVQGGASETEVSVRPLQTELIGPLEGTRLHPGSPVLLRVDLDWSGPGCRLRSGSIVQGRVVQVVKRSKTVKNAEVQLVFDAADCDGHPGTPHGFTLVALVGPAGGTSQTGQSGVSEAPPLAGAVGLAISGGIRSAAAASQITTAQVSPTRSLPSQIVPGQVVDVRRVNLSVGTGVDGATVIVTVGHDTRLEAATSLILVPRVVPNVLGAGAATPTGSVPAPASPAGEAIASIGTGSVAVPAIAPPAEALDETEICSGACTTVKDPAAAMAQTGRMVASLPIGNLGYRPKVKRQAPSFDDETTLTYLDDHNLLCTFDPHQLRQRPGNNEEVVRTIRAVLIDPRSQTVKRVLEWRVRGDNQYLWRLSGGRVLVHMGHELRLFDAELQPLRSIPVEGRVAWVASSPSSDHVAVGTIKERYADFVYREFENTSSEVPDEDVEVRVFDGEFHQLLTTHRSSHMLVPVLADEGELRVHAAGHGRWKIAAFYWDQTEHAVVTTKSTCRPVLSAPAHGLVFAVGCTVSGGRWYRMLRPDGHPVLKGESASDELEQSALGVADGAFAVRVVKAARAMSYGQPFNRSDLTKEEIGVYRSSDGANLSGVSSDDFAVSQLSYALAPSGDQIALVGHDSILFYAVKGMHP